MTDVTMPRFPLLLCLGWFCLVSCGCNRSEVEGDSPVLLDGQAIGTYYRITMGDNLSSSQFEQLSAIVKESLDRINQQMSTYLDSSEISRFNRSTGDDWFDVSRETALVVSKALEIHEASRGCFDITIFPLIELWGFGKTKGRITPPAREEITTALNFTGSRHLDVRLEPPAIKKAVPELQIDLSAIAKGYAVDAIVHSLKEEGIQNFLVDIGGEIRGIGTKVEDQPWMIAIESPTLGKSKAGSIQRTLPLTNRALATSGDYRNYFEHEGIRYSHAIDPRTGYPVEHPLVSVSVIAGDCMSADAWATALMIHTPDEALALANKIGLPALLIQTSDKGFQVTESTAFSDQFPTSDSEP